jgi:hypothetical protein
MGAGPRPDERRGKGFTMRSWRLLAFALFTAAALGPLPLHAQEPVSVSCDGFVIGYGGVAKQRSCVIVKIDQGTDSYKSSQLTVIDHTFFILMYYVESGYKAYLPLHSLQEMTDDSRIFSATGEWQEPRTLLGYDVAVFNGVLKGREIPSVCAVYSRYSGDPGRIEYSRGPGFKNHLVGYYCAVTETLSSEQLGDGFYSVMRDVIGKLQVPSAQ